MNVLSGVFIIMFKDGGWIGVEGVKCDGVDWCSIVRG